MKDISGKEVGRYRQGNEFIEIYEKHSPKQNIVVTYDKNGKFSKYVDTKYDQYGNIMSETLKNSSAETRTLNHELSGEVTDWNGEKLAKIKTYGYESTNGNYKYDMMVITHVNEDNRIEILPATKEHHIKYSPEEKTQLREYACEALYKNAKQASNLIKEYRDSYGIISIDALSEGLKTVNFIGQAALLNAEDLPAGFDFFKSNRTKEKEFEQKMEVYKNLKTKTSNINEFEKEFKNITEREVVYNAISALQKNETKLQKLSAYKGVLNNIERTMGKIEFAPNINILKSTTSENLGKLFGLKQEEVDKIFEEAYNELEANSGALDKSQKLVDFKNNLISMLNGAKTRTEYLLDAELNGIQLDKSNPFSDMPSVNTFSEKKSKDLIKKLNSEIETTASDCKELFKYALGPNNTNEAEAFIELAQIGGMLGETALTIITSIYTGGMAAPAMAAMKNAGTAGKIGSQLLKGCLTAANASIPATTSYISAITSQDGLTDEKSAVIKEKLKNGIIYGGLGAYVSGPIGQAVENALTKNIGVFSTALAKAYGKGAEISLDVVFDNVIDNIDVKESLIQNGIMNIGMAVAGGRLSKALSKQHFTLKSENDGTYTVKQNGIEVGKFTNANEVASFAIGKASDINQTINNQPMLRGETELPEATVTAKKKAYIKPESETTEFMLQDDIAKTSMSSMLGKAKTKAEAIWDTAFDKVKSMTNKSYKEIQKLKENPEFEGLESYVDALYNSQFKLSEYEENINLIKDNRQIFDKLMNNDKIDINKDIRQILWFTNVLKQNQDLLDKLLTSNNSKIKNFNDISNLIEVSKNINSYPDIFEKLMNTEKFNSSQVKTIMASAEIIHKYPDTFDKMLNKDTFLEDHNFLGSIRLFNEYSNTFDKLINCSKIKKGNEISFTMSVIKEYFSQEPDPVILDKIINCPKIKNGNDIACMLQQAEKIQQYPEVFDKIMNHPKVEAHSAHNLMAVAEKIQQYPEVFDKIMNCPIVIDDIANARGIMESADKIQQYPDVLDKILNCPKVKNTQNISELLHAADNIHKYPDIFEKVVNCPKTGNAFSISEIMEVANKIQQYPEAFDKIVNCPKIEGMGISHMMEVANKIQQYPEAFDKIVNCPKISNNNNLIYDTINEAADKIQQYPKVFDMIVNCQKGKMDNYSYIHEILQFADKIQQYPEIFNKVVNCPSAINTFAISHIISEIDNAIKYPETFNRLISNNNIDSLDIKLLMKKADLIEKNFDIFDKLTQKGNTYSYSDITNFMDIADKIKQQPNFPTELITPNNAEVLKQLVDYIPLINKNLDDLSRPEQRQLLNAILQSSYIAGYMHFDNNPALEKAFKLVPKSATEYKNTLNILSQKLNTNITPITQIEHKELNNLLSQLDTVIKNTDLTKTKAPELKYNQESFINDVSSQLQKLSPEEITKVKELFNINIHNNTLTGLPNSKNYQKDIQNKNIKDELTINTANQIAEFVNKYRYNNEINIENAPELSQTLNNMAKIAPELYNNFNGSNSPAEIINNLKSVVNNSKFETLNNNDKNILTIATLLQNTNKTYNSTTESAYDAYFLSKQLGYTSSDADKIYSIIQASDAVSKFMNTNRNNISIEKNPKETLISNKRNLTFDEIAFELKENNNLELAQMLYSSKEDPGLTRHFDKLLTQRINEIKAQDFTLPQTPIDSYNKTAKNTIIKGYEVKLVNASEIEDFYAFIHTPEANFSNQMKNKNRSTNLSNLNTFNNLHDEKILCTSYISKDNYCAAESHGIIFSVPNDKQFVGCGNDIWSLCKNTKEMLIEYYKKDNNMCNDDGFKADHRAFISNNLKEILNISDAEYIKRLDNIKNQLGSDKLTLEKLQPIDPEFAQAYKTFLSRTTSIENPVENALLRNDSWNEVLVSNVSPCAIFTKDLNHIPEEYLQQAQKENLPIVILN